MKMKRLAPYHALTLFFLCGLILLSLLFRGRIPLWQDLVFRYVLWIGLLFVIRLSFERGQGRLRTFVHTFSPILFIVLIYESLGDLIQYLMPDIDRALIRIDLLLFGVHPSLWMQSWVMPWLTDLLSLAYLSYYFIPLTLVLVLYLRDRPHLDRAIFILTLGYYVSFIGYILFPAVGPRYAMEHLYTVPLEGSFITDWVRDGLNAIEHNKRDVMPSGHTQLALMALFLAYRYKRVLFYVLLPIVSGLLLSTVYLRYHYIIDLIAGAVLAVVCFAAGTWICDHWEQGDRPQRGIS
jgi:membrane-associated phospholipid phosphatase